MKLINKPKVFQPIDIRIETVEELAMLNSAIQVALNNSTVLQRTHELRDLRTFFGALTL